MTTPLGLKKQETEQQSVSRGLQAAKEVKSGLHDLKDKLAKMKKQKEEAEAEMLKELEEYNSRKD